MMVSVLLDAVETLQGTEATSKVFQMPYEAGEMLSFGAFDIDKRVKVLRDALARRPGPAGSTPAGFSISSASAYRNSIFKG